jgi:hypothetical protein
MLHLEDSVTVVSLLLFLNGGIYFLQGLGSVTLRVWIKYPYIEECVLLPTPESLGSNICSCFISTVGTCGIEALAGERLQWRFQLHVVQHLLTFLAKEVPHVIMPHVNESTQFAYLGMMHVKVVTTWTFGRKVWKGPVVPH